MGVAKSALRPSHLPDAFRVEVVILEQELRDLLEYGRQISGSSGGLLLRQQLAQVHAEDGGDSTRGGRSSHRRRRSRSSDSAADLSRQKGRTSRAEDALALVFEVERFQPRL